MLNRHFLKMSSGVNICFYFFLFLCLISACSESDTPTSASYEKIPVEHPEWAKDATIYEVNLRHFTDQGTINAFRKHLPRLQELGVEIIWLMPVHPIGEQNRHGQLGSPYSVRDYRDIRERLGTKEDFYLLIQEAHDRGMKVIMDWVANHTAWDHPWSQSHPEWYIQDEEGNFVNPVPAWSDVIELNYNVYTMRDQMAEAMEYWVREFDVDGFRCDVAFMVPINFWNRVRAKLNKIKPVFMLAEAEKPDHHMFAFDASYSWNLHQTMGIITQQDTITYSQILQDYLAEDADRFTKNDYRMLFTTNHDINRSGSGEEQFGANFKNFTIMTFTLPGMPLIYGGQESGADFQLPVRYGEGIDWSGYPLQDFYSTLISLKKEQLALWSGNSGGKTTILESPHNKVVLYERSLNGEQIYIALNLAPDDRIITLSLENASRELFSAEQFSPSTTTITIPAHSHKVLVPAYSN